MKLKYIFALLPVLFGAAEVHAENAGLRYINRRGYVSCGTNLDDKSLAYRDEDGIWQGFDADICRAFAFAIFGDGESFQLKNVAPDQMTAAIRNNQADIILSVPALSAKEELNSPGTAIDVLYYDKQMFALKGSTNADSMEKFKGAKVCVTTKAADLQPLKEYSQKYNLEFNIIKFADFAAAKQAFYLNRCELLTAGEVSLKSMIANPINQKTQITVLPEVIAWRPIYAYTDIENRTLQIIGKWIFNALKLAEENGMTRQNIQIFAAERALAIQNLLGAKPELWQSMGLQPDWVNKAVELLGNWGEIFERGLGSESKLNIKRDQNNLIQNGGFMLTQPFV